MPTFLDLKTAVTGQLGGLDANTYVAKRETCINRARRRYYGANPWQYLQNVPAAVTMVAGVGTLPSDYHKKYDPTSVYFYSGNIKYDFTKVDWSNVPSYLGDRYVYAVGKYALGQVYTNHPEITTLQVEYNALPTDYTATDASQDTTVEPCPDTTAIEFLAIGYWWLSKERDIEKFVEFEKMYKEQLQLDIAADLATVPVRFFRPARPYLVKGYRSQL